MRGLLDIQRRIGRSDRKADLSHHGKVGQIVTDVADLLRTNPHRSHHGFRGWFFLFLSLGHVSNSQLQRALETLETYDIYLQARDRKFKALRQTARKEDAEQAEGSEGAAEEGAPE